MEFNIQGLLQCRLHRDMVPASIKQSMENLTAELPGLSDFLGAHAAVSPENCAVYEIEDSITEHKASHRILVVPCRGDGQEWCFGIHKTITRGQKNKTAFTFYLVPATSQFSLINLRKFIREIVNVPHEICVAHVERMEEAETSRLKFISGHFNNQYSCTLSRAFSSFVFRIDTPPA